MIASSQSRTWAALVGGALVLGLGGCGGSGASSTSAPAPDTAGAGQEIAGENEGFDDFGEASSEPAIDHGQGSARALIGVHPPEQPWAQLSHEDREMFMVGSVLPIHAEMFREFDAARYGQFECNNCHGDDGRERHYEMPSRYLPPLPAPGSPAWDRMRARNPRVYEFMSTQVTPTMATQLGMPPVDASGEGFGCFGCHPHAGG